MDRLAGFVCLMLVTLVSCQIPSETPTPVAAGNLVTNGDFSSGTADWGLYQQNGGALTLGVSGGVATLSSLAVGTGTEPAFDAQFKHQTPGFPLVAGRSYTLTYDAWADSPRAITVSVWENGTDTDHNGSSWGSYSYATDSLTTARTTFTRTFTMNVDNRTAGLCFACGGATATVHVARVSLVQD